MERLLALPRRPRPIFARNDFTAMGAMSAARDRGVSMPHEIAIAGFDNVPQSAFTTPPLTTVAQSTAEQGRAAARMLLDRIENPATPLQRSAAPEICLECRLIVARVRPTLTGQIAKLSEHSCITISI